MHDELISTHFHNQIAPKYIERRKEQPGVGCLSESVQEQDHPFETGTAGALKN